MVEAAALDVTGKDKDVSDDFELLFRQHSRFVYRTAYGITGNAADAEDLVQTVFTSFFSALQKNSRVKENPRAYLHRSVVNTALNLIKSRKSIQHVDSETLIDNLPNPAEPTANHEIRERLFAALDSMAESNAPGVDLLMLRYFHNLSDAAIAKMMGTSRGAIALRLHRAKARLKKMLKDVMRGDK
ncbi:MAG TPA: sigma-70 family RNA polymerase sigma factor [Terriglobia bacterium]|jgi:RNA polymerase sigma-70 factor (ECF subfamily)